MIYQELSLHPQHPENTLTLFVHDEDDTLRPGVVVFPGGGYRFLSAREAEPIARFDSDAGMNVYLHRYSVGKDAANYTPVIQGALCIKWIREHAAEHHTDPDRIVTCGFSAGGYAAASTGVFWNLPAVRDAVGITDGSAPEGINRPNGMILSYAVITATKYSHMGTVRHASGHEELTDEDIQRYSVEKNVDETTPPAFLWHTFTDTSVPVENAILMMGAMAEHKVPFEAHIFPEGPHGLSLCNELTWEGNKAMLNPHAAIWAELSVKWINECLK